MPFCILVQNFAEIRQSVDELWPKSDFQDGGCRHLHGDSTPTAVLIPPPQCLGVWIKHWVWAWRGGGQILAFSIDLLRRPYNTLAHCRATVRVCDLTCSLHIGICRIGMGPLPCQRHQQVRKHTSRRSAKILLKMTIARLPVSRRCCRSSAGRIPCQKFSIEFP